MQGAHQLAGLLLRRGGLGVRAQLSTGAGSWKLADGAAFGLASEPSALAEHQRSQDACTLSCHQQPPSMPSAQAIIHSWASSNLAGHWALEQRRSVSTTTHHDAAAASSPGEAGVNGSGASDSADDKQQQPRPPLSQDVHYEGPLSKTHKMLKRVSIANTVIACAAAPLIMEYASVSYVSRVGLASSLAIFGILTTGALHWITNPYIHELKFSAATQQIEVRMTTLFAGTRWDSFHLSDVKPLPWDRPVATFMAKNRFYYIDVYSFPDEDLLKRLTPDESTVPPGHKDDDDD